MDKSNFYVDLEAAGTMEGSFAITSGIRAGRDRWATHIR